MGSKNIAFCLTILCSFNPEIPPKVDTSPLIPTYVNLAAMAAIAAMACVFICLYDPFFHLNFEIAQEI